MSLHADRARASSFGSDPQRYDRARPTYPDALVEHLLDLVAGEGPVRVLDVGCGTGIASRRFANTGADVLGVEPDERMAELARQRGTTVEVASFESWDSADRTFDLIIAGQAWHWVEPRAGAVRAAEVLRSGGVLAPFWNRGTHPEVDEAFDRIYRERTPEDFARNPTLGPARRWSPDPEVVAAIEATSSFDPVEQAEFEWDRRYTRDEWLDQLPSHSEHSLLPPTVLAHLLDGIGEAIDAVGGSFTMHYATATLIARRR
ncbi:MAG: class I SAM-dependent methyltransferase [Actinomycetota bacterium]